MQVQAEGFLSDSEVSAELDRIRQLPSIESQVDELKALLPRVPDESLGLILNDISTKPDLEAQTQILEALGPRLSETVVGSVLDLATPWPVITFLARNSFLSTPALQQQAVSSAAAMTTDADRALALAELVPYLQVDRTWATSEAWETAQLPVVDPGTRVSVAITLFPYLPERQRAAAIDKAFSDLPSVSSEAQRAALSAALLPLLTDDQQRQMVLATGVQDTRSPNLAPMFQVDLLSRFLPYVAPEERSIILSEAAFLARSIPDPVERREAFAKLPLAPSPAPSAESAEPTPLPAEDTSPMERIVTNTDGATFPSDSASSAPADLSVGDASSSGASDEPSGTAGPTETPEGQVPTGEQFKVVMRALSDESSTEDLLDFTCFADALADFITNARSQRPLSIAIDAPWGMGKTTLMHMVERRLRGEEGTYATDDKFPTVWFDAWKYDQSTALWAALVLTILKQVREHLPWWQRLRLPVLLFVRRLDWKLLGTSLLRGLVYLALITVLGALTLGIVAFLNFITGSKLFDLSQHPQAGAAVGLTGIAAFFFGAGQQLYKSVQPLQFKIDQFLRTPNYEDRVGFLDEFQKDFARVASIVSKDSLPLVIFIDDLDRCSPGGVAGIVEAINVLLDSKNCVFVIGMDAAMVAASIETKYKDTAAAVSSDPDVLPLGQRFLEKIVQITFRLPRSDNERLAGFIEKVLGNGAERQRSGETAERGLGPDSATVPNSVQGGDSPQPGQGLSGSVAAEQEQQLRARHIVEAGVRAGKLSIDLSEGDRATEAATQRVQAADPSIQRETVGRAVQSMQAASFEEDEGVQKAICDYLPYLDANPRKIKRFINIFRLQVLIANRRKFFANADYRLDLLAMAVILATRWPDLVAVACSDPQFLLSLRSPPVQDSAGTDSQTHSLDNDSFDLSDPLVARLLKATDLRRLLDSKSVEDVAMIPNYLHLTAITRPVTSPVGGAAPSMVSGQDSNGAAAYRKALHVPIRWRRRA